MKNKERGNWKGLSPDAVKALKDDGWESAEVVARVPSFGHERDDLLIRTRNGLGAFIGVWRDGDSTRDIKWVGAEFPYFL